MLATIIVSFIASLPLPLAQEPVVETPREAYVEGWFQETAEADLESALAAYRRCLELAGPGDRELAARALWRMGMIARARDEVEVAEALLGRVVAEFGDTRAAPRAREALEAPVVPSGAESEVVQAALADLRDLLLADERKDMSLKRVRAVLRILSAEQIAAECRRQEETPAGFLWVHGPVLTPEHTEKLVDLMLLYLEDETMVRTILRALPQRGSQPLPDRVFELIGVQPPIHDVALLSLLARVQEDRAMAALESIAERSPELLEWDRCPHDARTALMGNSRAEAGEVFGRAVQSATRTREGLERLANFISGHGRLATAPSGHPLCTTTPGARHLRSAFPLLPPEWREALAEQIAKLKGEDPPRSALDLLLEDPEAVIRQSGLLRLVLSAKPDWRTEGLERTLREEERIQKPVLEAAIQAKEPIWPLEPLLDATEGALRELVYWNALDCWGEAFSRGGRDGRDALRIGLDRGDPELMAALFAPSDAFLRLPGSESGGGVPGGLSGVVQHGGTAGGRESLAARMIFAALASPDERIRKQTPELARAFLGADELAAFQERALADPSPRIRYEALRGGLRGVSPETVAAVLLDSDDLIFLTTFQWEPEAAALILALEGASAERRVKLLNHAKTRDLVEVVRACFELNAAPGSYELADVSFDVLKTREPDVLISGVTHPSGHVRHKALQQLSHLADLPEDVRNQVSRLYGADYEAAAEQRVLRERLEELAPEVARALKRWNVKRLQSGNMVNFPEMRRALAAELASLGEREKLLEYLLHSDSKWREVGGLGLVLLGDRESLRQGIWESLMPSHLLEYAVQLGLWEDCAELARTGRFQVGDLAQALVREGRHEDLARLLSGESWPVRERPSFEWIATAVATAADLGDVAMLSRAAERFDSGAAVSALFKLGELERILVDLPRWEGAARYEAVAELNRRTGETAEWPRFATEQAALLARWRVKLGLPPRGER